MKRLVSLFACVLCTIVFASVASHAQRSLYGYTVVKAPVNCPGNSYNCIRTVERNLTSGCIPGISNIFYGFTRCNDCGPNPCRVATYGGNVWPVTAYDEIVLRLESAQWQGSLTVPDQFGNLHHGTWSTVNGEANRAPVTIVDYSEGNEPGE